MYCNRRGPHMPGHLPAPSAGLLTNFCRFLVPPSQSLEHDVHFVHALNSQSFSHAKMLQALVSFLALHGLPLCFMATFTSRKRWVTPPPQFAEHLLQPVQESKTQSTGQGALLQLDIAARGKHFAPPFGCVSTLRISFCSPPAVEETCFPPLAGESCVGGQSQEDER